MDSLLLDYIDSSEKNSSDPYLIPSISTSTDNAANMETDRRNFTVPDTTSLAFSSFSEMSPWEIQVRGILFYVLNNIAKGALSLCNLDISPSSSKSSQDSFTLMTLGEKLVRLHDYLFLQSKKNLLHTALSSTQFSGAASPTITLSNFKSLGSRDNGETDPHVSKSCFNQAYDQLSKVKIANLRNVFGGDRVFNVGFEGEGGIDAGGVFREGMSRIMEDLFSPESLSLLIPCANAKHDAYENRDKFVPNPKWRDESSLRHFEFVGMLMGMSLRANLCLPFEFPPIVWKSLVRETLKKDDLLSFDGGTWKMIKDVIELDISSLLLNTDSKEDEGKDGDLGSKEEEEEVSEEALQKQEEMKRFYYEETFEDMLQFIYLTANGEEKELVKGGTKRSVTYDDREEYVTLLTDKKLHEFQVQCERIRFGLGRIVPLKTINLFSWKQLEVLICGNPVFDLALWKKNSENSGLSEKAYAIFWQVMESFTPEQQQVKLFICFELFNILV